MTFRAIEVSRAADGGAANRVALVELPDDAVADPELGDVEIDVEYSSLNFKDGLVLTGRPGVVRVDRLTAGIDLAGTVRASSHPEWVPGDRVIVNGCGLGETHPGGLAERARVRSEWLVRVPARMSTRQAAAIGTAGFTAALAVLALDRADVGPEVVVTGAAGGVGTMSILLGAAAGWRVAAASGRPGLADRLRRLGAVDVVGREELGDAGKPLQRARWDGAVDTVGGVILANVLARLRYGGTAAACGNAASASLPASVLPFILRGVSLVGINSVETPTPLRRAAWERLDRDLDLDAVDGLTTEIALGEAVSTAERFATGAVFGRTVVDVRR